jgi:hypothetical protein
VPEFWLSTTAGVHVPLIPLLDVAGRAGGVVPAQNGGIELKIGIYIGFDKIIPVLRLVVQPLIPNVMFEYSPAFNPVIITWPLPFAINVEGPTFAASSV